MHRDIKPSNLILDAWGKIWVTDFGLARVEGEASMTMTGDLLGTLRYMSPEQALAKRMVVDHRTDVYSLGATLYELSALRPAYDGQDRQELIRQIAFDEPTPLRRINRAVPTDLETIVSRAMAKDPRERYATAKELADDLRRFLEDKPIMARRPSLVDRAVKWSRRHRAFVAAAAIILVMTTIGLAVANVLITLETNQKNVALAAEREARNKAEENLYDSLVGQASALRLARGQGYRTRVFELLKQARALESSNLDVDRLRDEAVRSMGDFLGIEPKQLDGFSGWVSHVALRPGTSHLAVGLANGAIVVRDWATGEEVWHAENASKPIAMRYSPDGQRLFWEDEVGTIKVWHSDADDRWNCVRTAQIDAPPNRSDYITQDGSHLVSVSGPRVYLWSLTDMRPAGTYDSGGPILHRAAVSPD